MGGSLTSAQTQTEPNSRPIDSPLQVNSASILHQTNRRHLPTQRSNVVEVEADRTMVNASYEPIRRMEVKVKARLTDFGQKPRKPWLNIQ